MYIFMPIAYVNSLSGIEFRFRVIGLAKNRQILNRTYEARLKEWIDKCEQLLYGSL